MAPASRSRPALPLGGGNAWSPFTALLVSTLLAAVWPSLGLAYNNNHNHPCQFNALCSCKDPTGPTAEVLCYQAPLTSLPALPAGQSFYRVSLIGSKELFVLPRRCIGNSTVSALSVQRTKLYAVHNDAFEGSEDTLTTLDLSHNHIAVVPGVIARLPQLQWLSLKSNQIEEIRTRDFRYHLANQERQSTHSDSWSPLFELRTLLLADNRLTTITDQSFTGLSNLQSLDLSNNLISKVDGIPFPASLSSLSLGHNQLASIPSHAFRNLDNLKFLVLRNNLIASMPNRWFLPVPALSHLDLSYNRLQVLSPRSFEPVDEAVVDNNRNGRPTVGFTHKPHIAVPSGIDRVVGSNETAAGEGTADDESSSRPLVTIRDLLLDFNSLKLDDGIFKRLIVQRLSLSNNRLSSLPAGLFDGPLNGELRALDLNFNLLAEYPEAIKNLSRLTSLFLRGNKITDLSYDCFSGHLSDTLQSLDLSANLLRRVPSIALARTSRLLRLNLQENFIQKIDGQDFGWANLLVSLSLSKNSLQSIERNAFRQMKNLRELRLSYNSIREASPETLLPLRSSLEILELSYAIGSVDSRFLHSVSLLDRLNWLELASNRLRQVHAGAINGLPSLAHFDFDGNRLMDVPPNFFNSKLHSQLRNIILSNNKLTLLRAHTFVGLQQLTNLVASSNQLQRIESGAFEDNPALQTVILTRNRIHQIDQCAFRTSNGNSSLTNVFLQHNKLRAFSMAIFCRPSTSHELNTVGTGNDTSATSEARPVEPVFMYINASYNEISELVAEETDAGTKDGPSLLSAPRDRRSLSAGTDIPDHGRGWRVRVLDLTGNELRSLSPTFMATICQHLQSLYLSRNKLSRFPLLPLAKCTRLALLSLRNNNISTLEYGHHDQNSSGDDINASMTLQNELPFTESIQILDLGGNVIEDLDLFVPLFTALNGLRVLDLSRNLIKQLDSVHLAGLDTLEKLHLNGNQLHTVTSSGNLCLSSKLQFLDLSSNQLVSMPKFVSGCKHLSGLVLDKNNITEINEEEEILAATNNLHELSLSGNQHLHNVHGRALIHGSHLQSLRLDHCSLETIPVGLSLPSLVTLNLADNLISNVSSQALAKTRRLKTLDLSGNRLTDVPRVLWKYVTGLLELKLASNPIEILDTSSVSELRNLRTLDITGLELRFVDSRFLHSLRHLLSIRTSTFPTVRSWRLHDLLSKSTSIRNALIDVQENTLSHQIQWAFGPKLKELTITGSKLTKILPDAFLGLDSTDLILRITDTNVTLLPSGLLRYLSNRFTLIDLRRNKLRTLPSDVLQARSPTALATSFSDSFQVAGGLLLDANPWQCSCDLLWLSSWLRRWLRETRKYYVLNFDVFLHQTQTPLQGECSYITESSANDVLSESTSIFDFMLQENATVSKQFHKLRTVVKIPLLELYPETVNCNSGTGVSLSIVLLCISAAFQMPFMSFSTADHFL